MKFKRNNEEKSLRYSIRKYHVGAVSVAVSAMLFLGNSAVYAQNENNVSGVGTNSANTAVTDTGAPSPATLSGTESTGGNSTPSPSVTDRSTNPPTSVTDRSATSPAPDTGETTTKPNYDGNVSLIGQWTSESGEKRNTENTYKNATDKLGN